MLVSVAQQSESAMCIYMSPYPLPLGPLSPPPYPTPLGHRKAPSWFPVLCCCFPPANYFTFRSVYTSMLLSLRPSFALPPHVLKSIFYLYLFIPALPLGSSVPFFFRFHIYALAYGICFSLSDLLHCMTDPRSIHLTTNNSILFLFMANIPLYICATSSLSIHLSMDI